MLNPKTCRPCPNAGGISSWHVRCQKHPVFKSRRFLVKVGLRKDLIVTLYEKPCPIRLSLRQLSVQMVDYNAYGETPHQGNVWQAVKDTLAVAGKEVAGLSGTIRVGDFGSSAGSNSCEQLEVLVSAIRKEDEEKPIEVIHMDTLSNNWNDLFKTVSSHRRTYLKYPNTYAFGTAGTFYEQCFPRDSLSISYASMAYHWQEKDCVDGVDDTLFTQLSRDPAVAEAARDQAAREWLRILSLRAEELRAGGHLIALHMGRNRSGVLWDQLDRAWASMANDNKITSDEKRRVMFNVYSRTPEELLAPFQEELKDKLQVALLSHDTISWLLKSFS
eukprot:jgi/Botrbrau1/15884/Bobra.40_1s0067.2